MPRFSFLLGHIAVTGFGSTTVMMWTVTQLCRLLKLWKCLSQVRDQIIWERNVLGSCLMCLLIARGCDFVSAETPRTLIPAKKDPCSSFSSVGLSLSAEVPKHGQNFHRADQVQVRMPAHKTDCWGGQLLGRTAQMCHFSSDNQVNCS